MRRAQLWATVGAVTATLLLATAAATGTTAVAGTAAATADIGTDSDRAQPAAVSTLSMAGAGSPAPALFGSAVTGTFSRGGVPVLHSDGLDGYPCLFGEFGCREPVLTHADLHGAIPFTSTVIGTPLTACSVTSEWMSVRFHDATWGPIEGLVSARAVDVGGAEPGNC